MCNVTLKAAGPPTEAKSDGLEPKQYNRAAHAMAREVNPLIGLVRALARHAAASDDVALAMKRVTYGKNGTREAQF
jgi:hypothetical protein